MKRREFVRYLQRCGCRLFREGSRHSVYWNPVAKKTSAVPRHTEIVDALARKICRDLAVPPVKG
jgi:mRNA interferase HicA